MRANWQTTSAANEQESIWLIQFKKRSLISSMTVVNGSNIPNQVFLVCVSPIAWTRSETYALLLLESKLPMQAPNSSNGWLRAN